MTTFVLVPGGHHGAWCWQLLVPELERLGHRAVPVDLPCDDPQASYREYVDCVLAAMASAGVGVEAGAGGVAGVGGGVAGVGGGVAGGGGSRGAGEGVVLVGHSLGCYTVPLVAAERPVAGMVLLCAVPNLPGEPIPMGEDSMLGADLLTATRFVDESGLTLMTPADFYRVFYTDVDDATAWWALAQLRAQGTKPLTDPWPLEAWPDVPTTVVLAREDRVLRVEPAIEAARKLCAGLEPVVVPGGHSVMITEPGLLARVLVEAATAG